MVAVCLSGNIGTARAIVAPNQNAILLGNHFLWPGATTICPDGSGGSFHGQEVDIEVWNPNQLAAAQFRLLYDPNVATVIDPKDPAHPEFACAGDVESASRIFPGASAVVNYEIGVPFDKNGLKGVLLTIIGTKGTSKSGKLIHVYFQAKGTPGSKTALSLDPDYAFELGSGDITSPPITGTVQAGSISIVSMPPIPPILGDVNGDGAINLLDVEALLSAVVGRTSLTGPALKAADLDGNGQVDIGDVRRLLRQVVGL